VERAGAWVVRHCFIVAVGFFLFGMIGRRSVVHRTLPTSRNLASGFYFWQNMQFDFALVAALIIVAWAFAPGDLGTVRPYRWALILLVILALSPLLALTDTLVRPLAKSQYVARMVSGLVISAMVIVVWAYKAKPQRTLPALAAFAGPAAAHRLLGFACLMLLAVVPSDLFLTATWSSYLDALVGRSTRAGGMADAVVPAAACVAGQSWVLTSQAWRCAQARRRRRRPRTSRSGCRSRRDGRPTSACSSGATGGGRCDTAYRGVALLLWALVALNSGSAAACSGMVPRSWPRSSILEPFTISIPRAPMSPG
jgi:hypothetical protein